MKPTAAASDGNTAGKLSPPCWRMITTRGVCRFGSQPCAAAEVSAIHGRFGPFAAQVVALHFRRHGFAHLVAQDERGLVGDAQVAAHRQHAFALHSAYEDPDGREVGAQGELVRSVSAKWDSPKPKRRSQLRSIGGRFRHGGYSL
jgi:hypothetical protein